jgi:PAS domain S-box-containing protein
MIKQVLDFDPEDRRIEEAEETLRAIREGAVDAFVVEDAEGTRVYTLEGSDLPYGVLVERMQQGAAMLNAGCEIIYCNQSLTQLLGVPLEKILGSPMHSFLAPTDHDACKELLHMAQVAPTEGEMRLCRVDGALISANFSFRLLTRDKSAIGVLISDLTAQKHQVELAAAHQALRVSQEHLQAIFSASAVGIAVHTVEGRFLNANEAFCSITGYSSEELTELDCKTIIHPDDWEESQRLLNQMVAKIIPAFVTEKRYIQKGGRTVWVQNSVSLSRDAGDERDIAVVICEDISQRKAAEHALRESEDYFRTLADNINPFAWMAHPDGSIFWYNRRWFEYTGTTIEEMRGWGWKAVHHPDHVERVVEKFTRCFSKNEEWEDTFPLRAKDGSYRWFLSRAVPIRNENGDVVRWFGTNTDISERMRAEETLRRTEKLAVAGRLAGSIAHELNNPLAKCVNLLYLAQHDQEVKRRPEHLASAEQELKRISRLANRTLSFYRGSSARDVIYIPNLIDEVCALFTEACERNGIVLVHSSAGNPAVNANTDELRQALINVLSNAVDAIGVNGKIRISAKAYRSKDAGAEVRITIADTGCGISAESRAGIFEPFFTTKESTGTGLGLWITRDIIKKHEGKIQVRSRTTAGKSWTAVSLVLPGVEPSLGQDLGLAEAV